MAKYRAPRHRRASSADRQSRQSPSLILVGTTAAALSTVLVFGHATNSTVGIPGVQLAAATIGIGGRGDSTGANVPHKLNGLVVPNTFGYLPVQYPAGFDIDNSVAAGVPVLDQAIKDNSDQYLLVVGYSEGTLAAEKVRRNLDPDDPDAPPRDGLVFVMIASPNIGNGGVFGRFPKLRIPFVVTSDGAAQSSKYDTTYVTNEYDPYADFPAYFNPLALANTLMAVKYVHPDQYYDSDDYGPLTGTGTTPVLVQTVTNSAGGTDTYVFVPAEHLPLFAPVRQFAAVVHMTALTEPVLDGVEPVVRLVVDMGYTDRENLDPETAVTFSLITPPGKVLDTVAAVPGALEEGRSNFVTGVKAIPDSLPAPPTSAKSLTQQPQSLVGDTPATATPDPVQGQQPSDSGTATTEPPVPTQPESGPTLNAVTRNGHKAIPGKPGKTTSPKKNPLTALADTVKRVVVPKKPAAAAPSSQDSTPRRSASRGPTSDAA